MLKTVFHCLIIAALLYIPLPAQGKDLERIISTGPSWKSFTNTEGTGLYHEILSGIFAPHQIQVTHQYTNANRGIYLVRKGLADLYTCKNDTSGFDDLMLARYPMYEGLFYAIYKKKRIPKWDGVSTLSGKKVVWRRGYYKPQEFDADFYVLETDSGTAALAQVILDRGDLYIDDLNLIQDSISESRFPVDMDAYTIKPVGSRTYHPVFKKSPRGRRIMEMYDRGIEHLHRSGRLKTIFEKWHHPYPEYVLP